ncbi:MAG: HEAT repeat domain-containing protein [Myxococcales bacterium]|nr:HEAT repeat domain-containing protein [Myxococcales bacterium]
MEERPEALLRSALEKIVYFEARSEQLANDLGAAKAEGERLRLELAQAAQREIELRRQVAELEVRSGRAHAEREELRRMNEALRAERAELIGKLLEAARIHDAGQARSAEEQFDLARFIAELRSEALAKREQASAKQDAPALAVAAASSSSGVAHHAERLMAEGRLGVSARQLEELSGGEGFIGRTEETLFGFSVRELSALEPSARVRAAERLTALGHPAAAPALATALHAEAEPQVQVALLSSFAHFAKEEGAPVVAPLLQSRLPGVRMAALKALLAIDPQRAGPHLAAAMKDPDRAVRRRASLLALSLSGEAARKLGAEAIADQDPEVRRLAALVLGASGAEQAKECLFSALRDPEKRVRQAGAQSLSRLLGEDLSPVVEMDEAQRRREVRRLSSLPLLPPQPLPTPPAAEPQAPPRLVSEELCAKLLVEIRTAIRGRSFPELEAAAGVEPAAVREACELLLARGQVVRRGAKLFAA